MSIFSRRKANQPLQPGEQLQPTPRIRTRRSFLATLPVFVPCILLGGACDGLPQPANKNLRVSTDFEGGSAEIVSVNSSGGYVHIQPSHVREQGWPCWWYVKLSGMTKGQEVTLKVSANPRPFRGRDVLGSTWSLPTRAAISTDNVYWNQTPRSDEGSRDKTATYRFRAPAEKVWLAWGPPFLPSQAAELLERITKSTPDAVPFCLAHTREGNPVPALQIGGGTAEQPAKYGVWVQARQHAWEAGSSWVGRGFIQWVASDDPAAIKLRKQATIWYVPIMDVDRVAIGAGGKESVPQDHNRDWTETPYYPAVAAAQAKIFDADQSGKFDLFVDLHNPGHNDPQPYFFGPFDMPSHSMIRKRNYYEWLQIAKKEMVSPFSLLSTYRVADYVRDVQEQKSMSPVWVEEHTSDHTVAVTLETPWNLPGSTQAGYQTLGIGLAKSVASYIATDPRRKSGD